MTACHTLADAESVGALGPALDELAADAEKYRKQEGRSPEEYVKTAIVDPNAFLVPNFSEGVTPENFKETLSAEENDTLVKYLLTVGGGDNG
ncbi:MAG: hypothetical protein WKF32_00115 [Thermoleophilaceae bacterium]